MQREVYEKLANIASVQNDLNDDDINIWKLPHLVGATRLRLHISDWTMSERVLRDKLEAVADEGFWKSIGLGIFQLGLILLAPITEGLSLYDGGSHLGRNAH